MKKFTLVGAILMGLLATAWGRERILCYGDSITHGGRYALYLQLFDCLRHPGQADVYINGGVSGDTAAGGLKRFDWDACAAKPDRAYVMFGMNDVGRWSYATATADEKMLASRERSFSAYEKNQTELCERFKTAGVKLGLITPTPYNSYSIQPTNENYVSCNEPGLTRCADFVRRLAKEQGASLIDWHKPMTELFKAHPETAFCSDRVHPAPWGHLIMTAMFLEQVGASPIVEQTVVKGAASGAAFTYRPKALPFPKTAEYEKASEFWPLTEKMNQELIVVSGLLPKARYVISFDGQSVGSFTGAEFAAGINVALLDTPNQRVAQEAWKMIDRLNAAVQPQRGIVAYNLTLSQAKVDPTDIAAADAYLDKWVQGMLDKKLSYAGYHQRNVALYKERRLHKDEYLEQERKARAELDGIRPCVSQVRISKEN